MEGDELDYTIVPEDDVTLLSVRGEVDLANADALAKALVEASDHARPVVLDAGGLAFIDSAGFAAVQRAREHAALHLVVPPECPTARAFGVSGLAEVVPVHHSVDAARRSVAADS